MEQENLVALNLLNAFLKQKAWCDFDLLELKGGALTLVGSTDLTCYHEVEVKFEDVFFMQCSASWKTDTSQDVFVVPTLEEERRINLDNAIEQGHFLIKIIVEAQSPFYISSKRLSININTVYYSQE